ncbi:proteasome adapter and scaffold protein ECM29-like [Convolutriloba macropyga]|uniref:proteasome adapter and scaffold protein ECM29-like n=1 Tax=Convolutriloba macropyga TaxID=536237 RepID=UPI003F51FBEB
MKSANTSLSTSENLQSTSEKVATPRLNSVQVDKVGFALAACESDEQLEKAVNKYLLMLLVNTATDNAETRAKVMEILVHVNKRVKSRVNVQMPVRQLLTEFGSQSASVFFKQAVLSREGGTDARFIHVSPQSIRCPQVDFDDLVYLSLCREALQNFAIVYIKMGFSRLSYPEKVGLMPALFTCLHNQSVAHRWTLMTLFISVYAEKHFSPNTKISPVKESRTSSTGDPDPCDVLTSELLRTYSESTSFVLQFFSDVLLMPYVRSADTTAPGGFSTNSYKNLNQFLDSTYSEGYLETVKIGVTRLVFNMGVSSELKCPLLLLASSDTHSTVADVAENALRVINESVDQNNAKLVQKLCVLFCGDKRPKVPTEEKTIPVTTRTKLKILPVFLKSRLVANQPIDVISIVYESCFGAGTTNKLRHSALLFVHHVSTFANASTMKTVGPLLKNACVKLMRGDESVAPPADEKVMNYAAMAVAKLASKKPDLMRKDFTLLSAFFKRLKDGDREQKLALQECLALLAPVYSDLRETSVASDEHESILSILDSVIELRHNTSVNQIMIKFIQHCFPAWHVASRYFLLVVTDSSDDVFSLLAAKGKLSADFNQFLLHITSNDKVPLSSLDSDHIERVCHYLRHCLITLTDAEADLTCSELKQQSKHLQKSIETHCEMGKSYAKFLLTQSERNQTFKMFFYLTEVCHVIPTTVCKQVFDKRDQISSFIRAFLNKVTSIIYFLLLHLVIK